MRSFAWGALFLCLLGCSELRGQDRLWVLQGEGTGLSDNFGFALRGGVDYDQDGVGDLLISSPWTDPVQLSEGRVYLYSGATWQLIWTHQGTEMTEN